MGGNTEGSQSWQRLGRWSFGVHGAAVLTIIGTMFYVMISKRFEYFYAHSHVDKDLPFRYVFAAFWEGQEGSFLLWTFWHVGLGSFIILRGLFYNRKTASSPLSIWENPVLATLACVQVFLSSMILGLHFGFGEHIIKWGSNPILLLRETQDIPLFKNPEYVSKIAASAKGLNPLLQNYWMTILPPTLFLGFASTTIPFCFAIAGLWTKKYTEWLRPAMPFALFSATILGTGILMGGAWAYEALSFNGYWAWDPVENMSLVPWLVLVAGLHTHAVARATGHSVRATFAFYILTFLFVLYSTFLTRSGILGDTSVHAFTEIGLEWQLVFFQLFFLVGGLFLLAKNWSKIPNPTKDESITSREFWMFIGSLVLILSVVLMTFTTSIPVFNKILAAINPSVKPLSPPVDVVGHYNKTQLWIGVFMGFLSAGAQFLRFKEQNFKKWQPTFWKHLAITVTASALLTVLALQWIQAAHVWQFILLLFAGIFTAVSNLDYAVSFMRKNVAAAGSAFSHVGFGVLIVGIMASGINKTWISKNRFAMESLINFSEEQFAKNILLIKNRPLMTETGWQMEYESDSATSALQRDFKVKFRRLAPDLKTVVDSFTTQPHILYDKRTGKIASTNPDKMHAPTYDVFSYIAALPPTEQDPEIARSLEDSLKYQKLDIAIGETVEPKILIAKQTPQYKIEVVGINSNPTHPKYKAEEKDIAVGVKLRISTAKDSIFDAEPLVLLRGDDVYQLPVTINALGLRVKAEAEVFDKLFMQPKDLAYKEYVFSQGQTVKIGDRSVTFEGVDASPKVENFKLEPNDIAFAAKIGVHTEGGNFTAKPVFIIRGSQPMPLQDEIRELGMHFVISKVDPQTRQIHINIAQTPPVKLPIAIAENAPRTDYIVLEATVNPGINLVWLGSILMLFGLAMALVNRIRK